jgi:DNA-binding beta-propeller fold protein YncE
MRSTGVTRGGATLVAAALLLTLATTTTAQTPELEGTLVVVNKGASSVSIVDVASGRELAVLPTGTGPHEVALSSDGRIAVITDYGTNQPGNSLTVVDVERLDVIRTIDLGAYERPHGIAFLPGDEKVVVTSEAARSVIVVDVEDGTVEDALPTAQAGSHMLALPAPAGRVWTSNVRDGTVSEIDVGTGQTTRIIDVQAQPEAIGITPDGVEVWVGSNEHGTVSVVNAADGSVSQVLDGFGWPYRVLITPDGSTALIPDLRGEELRIVDRASRTVQHRISLSGGAPQGVAVTPDGRIAFQSLSDQARVIIIDVETGEVISYLPAGQGPDGVAYSPIVVDQD